MLNSGEQPTGKGLETEKAGLAEQIIINTDKIETENNAEKLIELKSEDEKSTAEKLKQLREQIDRGENSGMNINSEQAEPEEIRSLRQRFEDIESRQTKQEIYLGVGKKPIELAMASKEYFSKNPEEYKEIAGKIGTGEMLSARFNSEEVIEKLLDEELVTEELVIQGIESGSSSWMKDEKIRSLSVETLKQLSMKNFSFGNSLEEMFKIEVKKFSDLYGTSEPKKISELVKILANVQHLSEFMNKVSPRGAEQLKEQFNKSLEISKSDPKKFSDELYMMINEDGGRSTEILIKAGIIPKESILDGLKQGAPDLAKTAIETLVRCGAINSNEAVEFFKQSA